jgi:hypothetical protein
MDRIDKSETLKKCRAALTRVDNHVEQMLAQRERFEQMSDVLETWATKWSTTTLDRWLNTDALPLIEREKALVALALQASDAAGAVIRAYAPRGGGEPHKLFHQVARIEWEQRHRACGMRVA